MLPGVVAEEGRTILLKATCGALISLKTMLRIYFMQRWLWLCGPGYLGDALQGNMPVRTFAGIRYVHPPCQPYAGALYAFMRDHYGVTAKLSYA